MRYGSRLLAAFFALAAGALAQTTPPTDAADRTPSDFVRFVKEGAGGHLDTAITTYRKGDVQVVLFGAVHIADQACYDVLNDRFSACEALLYELVGPENYRPTKEREQVGFNPVGMLQQGLKTSMELSFQLDAIDYSPANFVHADMTPQEFQASMAERGESLLGLMMDMMAQGMRAQRDKQDAAEGTEPSPAFDGDLVKAFRTGQGRHTLRLAFASQLEELEMLAAGGKEGGTTLLEGRNEKCLTVLQREIAAGKKRLGIYYGAAHLPHMEQRLVKDLGFQKVEHEWLVAWDCKPRPDVKYDRALVQLRQRCKAELGTLAAVAREYRRQASGDTVPTVGALATAPADGKARYSGPVQDPWGQDYLIERRPTGSRWQVRSLGQDGKANTDDDLVVQEPRGGGLFGR